MHKKHIKNRGIQLEQPLMDLKQSPKYFAAISCYLGAFTVRCLQESYTEYVGVDEPRLFDTLLNHNVQ